MRVSFQTQEDAICAQVCVSFAKGLTNLMETTHSPGKKKKASAKRNFCTEDESDENLEQTLGEEEGEKEEQKGAGDGDTHGDEWVESFVDAFPKIKPKTTTPEKNKGKTNGKAKAKAKAKGKGKAKAAASPKAETPPKEARPIQKKGFGSVIKKPASVIAKKPAASESSDTMRSDSPGVVAVSDEAAQLATPAESCEEELQAEMLEESSVSVDTPHEDNEDESLDSSATVAQKLRKFNRDGHELPENVQELIASAKKDRKRRSCILDDIYIKVNGCYKFNVKSKYVIEANLAVEKKTTMQKGKGVLRQVAEKQVGGEDALKHILQTGQARVSYHGSFQYIVFKEYEVAWAFTTTHVPFIPT